MKRRYSKLTSHYKDYDYTHKLTDLERKWLDNFNDAEFGGNTNKLEDMTDVSKELKKQFHDNHNARRRDILNRDHSQMSQYLEETDGQEAVTVAVATLGELVEARKSQNGKSRNKHRKKKTA